jgi:hypothetical protein
MIMFNRMKNVVIQKRDDKTYLAHGVLEDHIYAMEVTVAVQVPDMTIIDVDGKIKRYTTHRCPPGIETLPRAVGMSWSPDVTSRIKKEIGRPGCRHLATILAECMESVAWAVLADAWEAADTENPADKAAFIKDHLAKNPQLAGACQALRP